MVLRLVSGRFKGKRLNLSDSTKLRPSSGKVREAIANLLLGEINHGNEPIHALDVFAGSGALGLEAISCGVSFVTFIDHHPRSCANIRSNLQSLELKERGWIIRADATRIRKRSPKVVAARIVLLDPPYGTDLATRALTRLKSGGWIASDALIVVETACIDGEVIIEDNAFTPFASRSYGDTLLTIFRHADTSQ